MDYCFSVTQLCLTLCNPVECSTPGLAVLHYLQSLLKLMSIESVIPYNHLILGHPLLLLPLIFPSIRVFCLLYPSGGQSIGASASASVLPMSIQGWFPLRLTGSNPGLPYCWQILYCLSHQGNQELPINSIKLHTLPSMQEMQKTQVTWVQSLGWEDPLKEEIATHSSFLAWRFPRTEEPAGL